MADFDNEELSRVRQWWAANGNALMIGVLVGLIVIAAWGGWNWYQNRQAAAAADISAQIEGALVNGAIDDSVVEAVERLENDYSGTPYATGAALGLASAYVADSEYDKAMPHLDWAVDNASEEGMRHIARVRKARLLWTQDDAEAALTLLETDHPAAFDALYAEVAGDIHAARGDREAAHQAYQRALDALPQDTPRQPLQNKLADNAPADDAGAGSEQESASAS
ncbi:membrane protein [Salinisphaera orenii MK-B5]|uniref:Ancillary SecYEG translocon subunit n=1 Tax=Salinisphaera orenii MK-B5 TaxID=856730 RepID=A0A423PGF8_9GAMM|nr:tetratricopeptide repeat protein [Salinisphaera orenii]ROO24729.1 membrane protein [Salinisphaera orenii MK-B5]